VGAWGHPPKSGPEQTKGLSPARVQTTSLQQNPSSMSLTDAPSSVRFAVLTLITVKWFLYGHLTPNCLHTDIVPHWQTL